MEPKRIPQEAVDIYCKTHVFGEAFAREFVRRLVLAGRLKIVSGGLNDNQHASTGQQYF